jgi:RNA polymerase sigma-70 factor (ECF subfamily)
LKAPLTVERTDDELIALWQNGNELAFGALYQRHVVKLIAIAMNKVHDRDSAQELVQDAFVKLYKHKDVLAPDTSIRAYLYVILKNLILNHYRKQLIQHKYESYAIHQQSFQDNSTMEGIESRELEKRLHAEIEKLPEKCKAVFLLSRKENLSNKEIATTLNISENTVEQHMRKALSRLRGSLGHYMELAFVLYFLNK